MKEIILQPNSRPVQVFDHYDGEVNAIYLTLGKLKPTLARKPQYIPAIEMRMEEITGKFIRSFNLRNM